MAQLFCKFGTLEVGINSDGDLYFGDDKSGYNLPDTTPNRRRIVNHFIDTLVEFEDYFNPYLREILEYGNVSTTRRYAQIRTEEDEI